MKELISVIMLTYNRQNYVEKAIESILGQTYENFEFTIVDNGSEDNSGKICDIYAQEDKRIRVIHTSRGSIGYGRNIGLNESKGQYITFIDDDDVAYPEMLEYLMELIRKGNFDISICGSHRSENGIISDKYVFDDIREFIGVQGVKELLKREIYNSANPTKLFKRRLFENIRYDEEGKYDDIKVMYKLFAVAKGVIVGGKPLYRFNRHSSNNSGFITKSELLFPEQLDEYFKAFRERTAYLSEIFPEEADFFKYTEWSYLISMYDKIVANNLKNCHLQKDYIMHELKEVYNECNKSIYINNREKEILKSIQEQQH